jgi:hypothetical protein
MFDWFRSDRTPETAPDMSSTLSDIRIDRSSGYSQFTIQVRRTASHGLGEWELSGHVESCQIRNPRLVPVAFTALVDGRLRRLHGVGHVISMSGRSHGVGYTIRLAGDCLSIMRDEER